MYFLKLMHFVAEKVGPVLRGEGSLQGLGFKCLRLRGCACRDLVV